MSTLKTHNLQSPDAGSVNIALTANAGMIVTGISTFNDQINIGSLGVTNGGDLTFLNSSTAATADLNSIIFSNNSGEISRIRGQSRNGNTNGMITFHTDISGSSAERMRVNHDGAFCFGNDSARPAEFSQPDGFSIRFDDKGQFQNSVTSTTCGLLNRKGTDGDILSFRKAGTGVGHIGVTASTMYLNFNGSSVPANQLDDYEEGSWTPTILGWDTFTHYSGSSYYAGWYVKVGNMVHCGWKIYYQNLSTPSSNTHIRISGLPYAAKTISAGPVCHVRFDIPDFSFSGYPVPYLAGNDTTIGFYKQVNGSNNISAINATGNYSNNWTMGTATYATN